MPARSTVLPFNAVGLQLIPNRGLKSALGVLVAVRLPAVAKSKPPVYTYVATWEVPRAQWGEMVKLDEQDKP